MNANSERFFFHNQCSLRHYTFDVGGVILEATVHTLC
jgi:hypothetical protein